MKIEVKIDMKAYRRLQRKFPVAGKVWRWNVVQHASKMIKTVTPVRTGELKKSIKPKKIRAGVYGVEASEVFDYVDSGTKPHIIKPRVRKALRFIWEKMGNIEVFFKKVKHPGIKAQHIVDKVIKEIEMFANQSLKLVMKNLGL
jgi:hypothetical protein